MSNRVTKGQWPVIWWSYKHPLHKSAAVLWPTWSGKGERRSRALYLQLSQRHEVLNFLQFGGNVKSDHSCCHVFLHWRKVDLCLFHSLERQRPEGQTSEQDVQWAEVGVVRQRLDAVTGGRGNIDPVITRELHAQLCCQSCCRQVHQVPSTRVRWEPPPETRTGLIFVDFVVGKLVIAARSHQQHELVIKSGLYEAAARLLWVFLLIFSFT